MRHQDDEMPEEYRQNAAKLAEFLEKRETCRAVYKDLPPDLQAQMKGELPKFDKIIDELETLLAADYVRIMAAKASDARISDSIAKGWETSQKIDIIIKHTTPHMLEKFTAEITDPMDADMREEFLDGVAILETTKLSAILKR